MGFLNKVFGRRRETKASSQVEVKSEPNLPAEKAKPALESELPYAPIVMDCNAPPAWAANEVRDNVNDPEILAEIAVNAPLEDVRIAAIRKITDQQVLLAIALDDHSGIVKEARIGNVWEAASERLSDPALLKRFALGTDNGNWVYGKLHVLSQADLAEVARDARDELTRKYAVDELQDEESLAGVATGDDMAARSAIGKVHDPALLRCVFGSAASDYVKGQAIKRAGGYLCGECGEAIWPEGEGPAPCTCPGCGTENHDWRHAGNVTDYRDYSAGTSWEECSRCGVRKNYEGVNVGGM